MVVGLALLFVGFEWQTQDYQAAAEQGVADVKAEEEVEITKQDTPPPPPPASAPVVVADALHVVDDNVKLADVTLMSSEDNQASVQSQTYTAPPAAVHEEEEESAQPIFTVVEKMPEFPGGQAALLQFLSKSIKYPVIAQENGIQGRVTCSFVVNRDGSIVDAQVLRGVDPSLDKEALRVINSMPKWKPGEQRGIPCL
jgi:protein TonB